MKKMVLSTLVLLTTTFSYGQVTMMIDSVDISRVEEIMFDDGGGVVGNPTFPRVRIIVTIENKTSKNVYLRGWEDFFVRFGHKGTVYNQYSAWITSNRSEPGLEINEFGGGVSSLTIMPDETKELVLVFFPPTDRTNGQGYDKYYRTFPVNWNWGKEELTDADYLEWFKWIVPTMRIIVDYTGMLVDTVRTETLISEPIDMETVVVTSRLGAVSN